MIGQITGPTSEHSMHSMNSSNGDTSFIFKRRKIDGDSCFTLYKIPRYVADFLPVLRSADYFVEPPLDKLVSREVMEKGYCSRVRDFTVGRVGYGRVRFFGETDVRWMDLDKIVTFETHKVTVYPDERNKPSVGQGLNKPAEVTLVLQAGFPFANRAQGDRIISLLKKSTERQGAHFISFNPLESEWKFSVCHFSRFGLTDEDDEEGDLIMDDAMVQEHSGPDAGVPDNLNESPAPRSQSTLFHSHRAHLRLNPAKMREMKMLLFDDESEETGRYGTAHMKKFQKQPSAGEIPYKSSLLGIRKCPQALLEYTDASSLSSPRNLLMIQQSRDLPIRGTKVEGFKLDLKRETPVTNSHSKNVVDAALFMGRSFRVGWGLSGVLVHSGKSVSDASGDNGQSSIIYLEKVDMKGAIRDRNNEVREVLVDACFSSLLNYHKSLEHKTADLAIGPFKLKLQKIICNRFQLLEICRKYVGLIEIELDVSGLSISTRTFLMHQVTVWELIKVLFLEREISKEAKPPEVGVTDEDMLVDKNNAPVAMDPASYPLVRRAEFSLWLEDSVHHHVQEEISFLSRSSDLEHIFLLLTGRQLDSAVELAANRGDVRMACLLSQAGGSMVNRTDMSQQLDVWRTNGMDFRFMESERLKIYELLAGNIQDALGDSVMDWKRYLGLLMWYQLPPEAPLPLIIRTFERSLLAGRAPYPVPIYIDEGPLEGAPQWHQGDRFDMAYYLMLLYANDEKAYGVVKTMFSALSSTFNPLDYHMIWHQRTLLEAIDAFSSDDLHILDMSFVSQLLCLGQCHWAIYVVLHMPRRDDCPYLQATVIREILFQYCEYWSRCDMQRQFIEDLGVPVAWLHEALGMYFQYHGDLTKAFHNYVECCHWQKAHSIFMTSVAHTLFFSSQHLEVWKIVTSMEEHKKEIADWALGAGLFLDFYILKSALCGSDTINELDSLEKKNQACRDFFSCLNNSLSVWGSRLPIDARAIYSRMAEELCGLLMSDGGSNLSREVQLSCFDTMFMAPLPAGQSSCHIQDAVLVFAYFLSETTS